MLVSVAAIEQNAHHHPDDENDNVHQGMHRSFHGIGQPLVYTLNLEYLQ